MDMLRIVMIGPFGLRPRGTMSARALPLAKALARRGHQVVLLMPPWQNPEDAGRRWEEDGVTVENIALPARTPLLFHLLTALRLARRALSCQPDVVHLFKPKAYSGLVHWLLWRRPRRPRLVVDTDDWEGPGGWNDLAPYSPAQRRFFAWQERWGLTHADAVTVASRTLQSLVWALGVPPDRVLYVPNGISPVDAAPRVAPPPPPTVLLYTRFFEFPVERVVDLLRRVRRAMPATRLLVVGEGLFGEEERLLELARQNGLTEAIEYAGWAPEELARHFARAHLAIYPFDDTLINRTKCPAKLVELAAAGIPIVAEAVGEIPQTLRHGETGWLVEAGDVAGFAGAVVRLLEDAPLRERLGRAAAQDVQGRLAWERLAETVERAYRG
jgi:glycosyltransferase involved in cell wall biosynthesis